MLKVTASYNFKEKIQQQKILNISYFKEDQHLVNLKTRFPRMLH